MNKIKPIIICLLILLFITLTLTIVKFKQKEEFKQKARLAQEIRKALDHLMVDIFQESEGSINDLPADGLWRNHIAFVVVNQGALEYSTKDGHMFRINKGKGTLIADHIADLRFRRQATRPDLLEVQIEAKQGVSLTSNLRIRIK